MERGCRRPAVTATSKRQAATHGLARNLAQLFCQAPLWLRFLRFMAAGTLRLQVHAHMPRQAARAPFGQSRPCSFSTQSSSAADGSVTEPHVLGNVQKVVILSDPGLCSCWTIGWRARSGAAPSGGSTSPRLPHRRGCPARWCAISAFSPAWSWTAPRTSALAVFITIGDSVQQDGAHPCLVFHAGDLVSSAAYTGVWYAAHHSHARHGRPRSAATRPPMTSILHCSSLVLDC